jgi:hypothetical protein
MIDKSKTYKTRDGHEVRIYATDGESNTVHGAILTFAGWAVKAWRCDGRRLGIESDEDLIEVRPRHKRTVWLNVYNHKVTVNFCKEIADRSGDFRIACIKVELDFEEGEGL